MPDQLDCVVVGAGVVGLAVGRELAGQGREVIVLESEPHIGMHSSSRNSEVIHAGLYYPQESLKARLCVRGKHMLYDYCEQRQIDYARPGKLIVASDEESIARLKGIQLQATKNGVNEVRLISKSEARQLEPAVVCEGALLSSSTGIIDSHALMLSLQADIESRGGTVLVNNEATDLKINGGRIEISSAGERFECRTLVNSAGLRALDLVSNLSMQPAASAYRAFYARGHYFSYQGAAPFEHLVYPLPSGGGLGIHATLDLAGGVRFGPDVQWIDTVDYSFDEGRKPDFVEAIATYYPALDESRLIPSYTGVRSKLAGPEVQFMDFVIQDEQQHGSAGLINLFGIESPGLTSALAIAEYVKTVLTSK